MLSGYIISNPLSSAAPLAGIDPKRGLRKWTAGFEPARGLWDGDVLAADAAGRIE